MDLYRKRGMDHIWMNAREASGLLLVGGAEKSGVGKCVFGCVGLEHVERGRSSKLMKKYGIEDAASRWERAGKKTCTTPTSLSLHCSIVHC